MKKYVDWRKNLLKAHKELRKAHTAIFTVQALLKLPEVAYLAPPHQRITNAQNLIEEVLDLPDKEIKL